MPELESLASEETLEKHVRRHHLDRLIMLSDGVFAIAMTLAAIEVHLPHDATSLEALLHDASRPILAYVLSFMLAAIFWVQHRDLFARLQLADGVLTTLTIALLGVIALIPAMVNIVIAPGGTGVPFRFYALAMAICGTLVLAMWLYAAFRPGVMKAEVPWSFRVGRIAGSLASPLIFLPNIFLPIDQTTFLMLPVALALVAVRRVIVPRLARREGSAIPTS